jgi:glycosyltransferase involved in cell wall biosynthesis
MQVPGTASSVSAVITTFNYAAFIREALESVLSQTRLADEVVVIDDGSTDDTASIVREYGSRGVRYFRQENAGAGAARNRGIRETTGDLIAFLDADDIWLPDKLAAQVAFLEERPDAVAVSGSHIWWHVRDDVRWVIAAGQFTPERMRRELTVRNVVGNPSMMLFRRSALEQAGLFDPTLRWGQDWELCIRLARLGTIGMLPQPLIVYRWHEQSLSNDQRWRRLETIHAISRAAIADLQPAWQRPIFQARAFSSIEFDRARIALSEGRRWPQRVWHAALAFATYPFEQPLEKGALVVRSLVGTRRYVQTRDWVRGSARRAKDGTGNGTRASS